MDSSDNIDKIKTRLAKVERQARNTRGWLIVLGICVFISLFGSTALRLWQINTACEAIVAENPHLQHSDCMLRVHKAWKNDQDTIRLD
jgi:uncharacterized membrane protein